MGDVALNADLIREYLNYYALEPSGDLEAMAGRLRAFITDLRQAVPIARCSVCGEHSPMELPVCPFCGEEGQVEPQRAPPPAAVSVPGTERELDEAIQRFFARAKVGAEQVYAMAREMQRIRDAELWRLRVNKRGHSLYTSFYRFAEAELGMGEANARRLISVCSNYTLEEFREYGPTRLSYALRAPEKQRQAVLEATRAGTAEDTKAAANVAKEAAAEPPVYDHPRPPRRDRAGAIIPPKPVPKPARLITVPIRLGVRQLPLYRRPTDDAAINRPTEPARSLSEDPWFALELAPGLMLNARLTRSPTGEGVAFVELRLGEPVLPQVTVPLEPVVD